jgi:helicase
MAFKGLFIGIDRYASPEINWLSCASRDATALHALFTDTFGGDTAFLTDAQATVTAIRERFEQLVASDPDDIVVIAFSGHGTETHELVAYDTDRYDFDATAIPLTTLADWCARIPARRLLIILDCCFSGGMGAKALQVEGVPRDIPSVESKLNQISGQGRVILTASGPTEKAWESSRLGHGYLTLYLLEALQGPPEIREGDRIAICACSITSSGASSTPPARSEKNSNPLYAAPSTENLPGPFYHRDQFITPRFPIAGSRSLRLASPGHGSLDEGHWPTATEGQRPSAIEHLGSRRLLIRF